MAMHLPEKASTWWGPPRKFSTELEDRKVSWLELFYDLVYVIAISKITHHLAEHLNFSGLLDYTYFFAIIFWGWVNGSLYHDLHGASGLRTRLMTLWQMVIVAALVVTLNSPPEKLLFNATIALLAMQLYITYLWWSVGIYDKAHRNLNRPYTVIYLISFALMFLTLFLEPTYVRIIFYASLILNYLPPFLTHFILERDTREFRLSASMSERLGLFTIIIFGEVVLGVVNGTSALHELDVMVWLNFGLAILIVFSLWWTFFTLISDRECKKGLNNSSWLEIFYIPTLMALGLIGASFSGIFESFGHHDAHANWLNFTFSASLSGFLLGMIILLFFLEYPSPYSSFKKSVQQILFVPAVLFFILAILDLQLSLSIYLGIVSVIILTMILVLNQSWYRVKIREEALKNKP